MEPVDWQLEFMIACVFVANFSAAPWALGHVGSEIIIIDSILHIKLSRANGATHLKVH
jgi:hypothetical protein